MITGIGISPQIVVGMHAPPLREQFIVAGITHWYDAKDIKSGAQQTLQNRITPTGTPLQMGSTTGADSNDPTELPVPAFPYAVFPGTVDNALFTNQIEPPVGSFTVEVDFYMDDKLGLSEGIIGQYLTGGNHRVWAFRSHGGVLQAYLSADGATVETFNVGSALSFSNLISNGQWVNVLFSVTLDGIVGARVTADITPEGGRTTRLTSSFAASFTTLNVFQSGIDPPIVIGSRFYAGNTPPPTGPSELLNGGVRCAKLNGVTIFDAATFVEGVDGTISRSASGQNVYITEPNRRRYVYYPLTTVAPYNCSVASAGFTSAAFANAGNRHEAEIIVPPTGLGPNRRLSVINGNPTWTNILLINDANTLGLYYTHSGGVDFSKVSTAPIPYRVGTKCWVSGQFIPGVGVVFETSLDGITWTQLGTTVTSVTPEVAPSAVTQLLVSDVTPSRQSETIIFQTRIKNLAGTVISNFNPSEAGTSVFGWTGSDGIIWSTFRSINGKKTVIASRDTLLFDGSNDWMQFDLADYTGAFNADETVMQLVRVFDDSSALVQGLLSTRSTLGGGTPILGMGLRISVTTGVSWSYLITGGDGTTAFATSGNVINGLPFGVYRLVGYRYTHSTRSARVFSTDGVTLTQAAGISLTGFGTVASGNAARVGASVTGGSPLSVELPVPFVRAPRVLNDQEILAFAARLIAGDYT